MTKVEERKWECSNCHSTLGFIDGTDILRLKYKDLYFFVNVLIGTSQVKVLCRKCGKINTLIISTTPEKHLEPKVMELEKFF